MKFLRVLLLGIAVLSVATPAHAATWGQLKKGECETTSGKRKYKAKLKRNFGDDPSAELCYRLQKTVNGVSRVPDVCVKRGLNGHSGIWLVADPACGEVTAKAPPAKTES